jgi:hypothetical protein
MPTRAAAPSCQSPPVCGSASTSARRTSATGSSPCEQAAQQHGRRRVVVHAGGRERQAVDLRVGCSLSRRRAARGSLVCSSLDRDRDARAPVERRGWLRGRLRDRGRRRAARARRSAPLGCGRGCGGERAGEDGGEQATDHRRRPWRLMCGACKRTFARRLWGRGVALDALCIQINRTSRPSCSSKNRAAHGCAAARRNGAGPRASDVPAYLRTHAPAVSTYDSVYISSSAGATWRSMTSPLLKSHFSSNLSSRSRSILARFQRTLSSLYRLIL